jgi:hypothetical protein
MYYLSFQMSIQKTIAQLCFMQSRWNIIHFVLIAASIGVWYGSAFVITTTRSLDFDWYYVSLLYVCCTTH